MAFQKLTVDDIEVGGRRVLLRVDFNVPLADGAVSDSTRLEATLPTLTTLLERGGRLVLMSHLGRPKGSVDPALSLRPVAARLGELLGREVRFFDDCIGAEAEGMASDLKDGELLLLENVRFYGGEEANDPDFAAALARLGDIFVNDAFGTAHRAHASTVGVTRLLETSAAGYLMAREIEYLGNALDDPARPFIAILGGAKISGKIDVIEALRRKVDHLLVGGGMAFTFLAAQGLEVGRSLVEEERLAMARNLLESAAVGGGAPILLPEDVVVAGRLEPGVPTEVVGVDAIPADLAGYDIGPRTVEVWRAMVADAGTIVWNGPMGVFEIPPFDQGTVSLAESIAEATDTGTTSIIGGGDSAAAVVRIGIGDRMSHVSTGGGASLEFLEGKVLPGVDALTDRSQV
jgi:phosphoglycerate kinase